MERLLSSNKENLPYWSCPTIPCTLLSNSELYGLSFYHSSWLITPRISLGSLLWTEYCGLPPFPNLTGWSRNPQCDGIGGGGGSGRWLGQEDGAFVNGISAPLRRDTERSSLSGPAPWGRRRKRAAVCKPGRNSLGTKSASTLIWTSQPPELWEINFSC